MVDLFLSGTLKLKPIESFTSLRASGKNTLQINIEQGTKIESVIKD